MKRYITKPLLVLTVCGVIAGGGAAAASAASSSSGTSGQQAAPSKSAPAQSGTQSGSKENCPNM